jgi:predicted membrane chloride channel (bestrophin family)
MGIEGIADEIEQPFGTDKTDLPLGASSANLHLFVIGL